MTLFRRPWCGHVILWLAALFCMLGFRQIGSYVDEQGVLREPFGLIPLGYLFATAALCWTVCLVISAVRRRNRRQNKPSK